MLSLVYPLHLHSNLDKFSVSPRFHFHSLSLSLSHTHTHTKLPTEKQIAISSSHASRSSPLHLHLLFLLLFILSIQLSSRLIKLTIVSRVFLAEQVEFQRKSSWRKSLSNFPASFDKRQKAFFFIYIYIYIALTLSQYRLMTVSFTPRCDNRIRKKLSRQMPMNLCLCYPKLYIYALSLILSTFYW